jgi:hypothetical protein
MASISLRTVDFQDEESKTIFNRTHRYAAAFHSLMATREDARLLYQGLLCPIAVEKVFGDGESVVTLEIVGECQADGRTRLLCAAVSRTIKRDFFKCVSARVLNILKDGKFSPGLVVFRIELPTSLECLKCDVLPSLDVVGQTSIFVAPVFLDECREEDFRTFHTGQLESMLCKLYARDRRHEREFLELLFKRRSSPRNQLNRKIQETEERAFREFLVEMLLYFFVSRASEKQNEMDRHGPKVFRKNAQKANESTIPRSPSMLNVRIHSQTSDGGGEVVPTLRKSGNGCDRVLSSEPELFRMNS